MIHWLLIASLALGAPVASCCQWGAIARSAVASMAAAPDDGACCCGAPRAGAPVSDERAPCDDDGTRCTCGPSKSIFAETSTEKAGGPALAAVIPAHQGWGGSAVPAPAPLAVGRGGSPPVLSLLHQHCALTI